MWIRTPSTSVSNRMTYSLFKHIKIKVQKCVFLTFKCLCILEFQRRALYFSELRDTLNRKVHQDGIPKPFEAQDS